MSTIDVYIVGQRLAGSPSLADAEPARLILGVLATDPSPDGSLSGSALAPILGEPKGGTGARRKESEVNGSIGLVEGWQFFLGCSRLLKSLLFRTAIEAAQTDPANLAPALAFDRSFRKVPYMAPMVILLSLRARQFAGDC